MNMKLTAVIAVIALAAGGAGAYLMTAPGVGTAGPGPAGTYNDYSDDPALSWSYWLGDMDSAGVTDAKSPVVKNDMTERWKVSDAVDASSTNWKVPGSAICVGDKTYFFRGSDNTLNCVRTATGETVAKASCPSGSVYNMALAYGDGKIFVPVLSGSSTVMHAYDAETLRQLFVSEPVRGGEVQGPVTYYEGRVYFGTYGGDFACFSSQDTDASRSDEAVSPLWNMSGDGWYNMSPGFFEDYCVIAEKGFDIGGAILYSVEIKTGAVKDTLTFDLEYCVSGITSYKGRAYIALNMVTDKSQEIIDSNVGKTLKIRSFAVSAGGTFDRPSEKVWISDVKNGGTQSTPVIWNDRLYIGGGGSTMGTNEPFTVLEIAKDGTMAVAYKAGTLLTKGTASITTAYSTEANGYAVYIYLIEYGKVLSGQDWDSPIGTADIFVLKDAAGQKSADVVFKLTPSMEQFAYQSFAISPDGYLLVRNDSTLFCFGPASPSPYTYADVMNAIDRIISMAGKGNVNPADAERAEARYAALSAADKARVANYGALQDLYVTVVFKLGDQEATGTYLKGSVISAPNLKVPDGKAVAGWSAGGADWNFVTGKIESDMTLTARLSDAAVVSFDAAGGSAVGSIYVRKGAEMGYVKDPVRNGYTFGGWFSGSTQYAPQHSIASSDVKLTARWLKDSTVSFDTDGGSSVPAVQATYTKKIGDLPSTSKSGYKFTGWYYGDTLYTEDSVFNFENNITLKAKWSENTVSSVSNGKGIIVTGSLPGDASIVAVKPFAASNSVTQIKNAAGMSNMDFLLITINGDGADGSQAFQVTLPVGAGSDGKSIDVYYFVTGKGVTKVTGTVSGGVLNVTLYGETSSSGAQIVLGLAAGTELMGHV